MTNELALLPHWLGLVHQKLNRVSSVRFSYVVLNALLKRLTVMLLVCTVYFVLIIDTHCYCWWSTTWRLWSLWSLRTASSAYNSGAAKPSANARPDRRKPSDPSEGSVHSALKKIIRISSILHQQQNRAFLSSPLPSLYPFAVLFLTSLKFSRTGLIKASFWYI